MNRNVPSYLNIDELHSAWEAAHKSNSAPYLPENIPTHAFLPDGIISRQQYEKSNKLLFIGKEAYWYYSAATLAENEKFAERENLYFWHRRVAFGKTKETIFSKRLSMLVNALNKNDFQTINKNHDCLQSIAFINLNKRGGYNYCVWDVLDGYVKQYAEYIAQEILLINPSLIICCGHDVKWMLDKYVSKYLPASFQIIAVHHPSYFILSDEKYLHELQCALEGKNWISEDPIASIADAAKGIIFDTNKTYSAGALYDMLTGRKISAYERASRFVNSFNVGDYAFYYVKGKGIVAVGKVISDTATLGEYEGDSELFKMVDILVPQNLPFEEENLQAISPSALKELVGHGFYFASTTKRPYLTASECKTVISALRQLYQE